MMKVLVVCLGNICRSPVGQAALEAAAPDWQVDSAGTGDWHVGDPPYGPMQVAAKRRGMDLGGQRARQVTPDDFAAYDVILAMDRQNRSDLEALRPAGNLTPVRPFAGRDVPDPYYTRDFDGCLDIVLAAAEHLVSDSLLRPDG